MGPGFRSALYRTFRGRRYRPPLLTKNFFFLKFPMDIGSISAIIPFGAASVAHLVERHLAKVEVASSSLVTRSKKESPAKRLGFFSGDEARTIPSDSPADCRALPAGRQCNHTSAGGTRRRSLVTRSKKKSPAKRLGFLLLYSPARWGVCKTDDSLRLLSRGDR